MTDTAIELQLSKEQQEAIDKFNGMLAPILEAAKIEIKDQADLVKSGDAKISLEAYIKAVKAHFELELSPLEERVKRIKNQITTLTSPASPVLKDLVERQRAWMAEEKRKSEAETKRKSDELLRLQQQQAEQERRDAEKEAADKKRDKVAEINADAKAGRIGKREAAKRLKEAGAEAEAAIETAAAVAEEQKNAPPPEVRVVPNIPKVAGVKNQTYYKSAVMDGKLIVQAFAAACASKDRDRAAFLWPFLCVNEKQVGVYARETQDPEKVMRNLPGVKAWSEG
jgi:hypothetical protein